MNYYRPRDLGRAVPQRRWTPAAIECLKRNCICEGCFYDKYFKENNPKQKCQMKAAVLELKRTIGNPAGYSEKTFIDDTNIQPKEIIPMTKTEIKQIELPKNIQQIVDEKLTMLSPCEKRIAGLILNGKTNEQIAEELNLSVISLPNYKKDIFLKTDEIVNYRTQRNKTKEFVDGFLYGIFHMSQEESDKLFGTLAKEKPLPLVVTVNPSIEITRENLAAGDISCNVPVSELKTEEPSTEQDESNNIIKNINGRIVYSHSNSIPNTVEFSNFTINNFNEGKLSPDLFNTPIKKIPKKILQEEKYFWAVQSAKSKYETELNELYTKTGKEYIEGTPFEKDYRAEGKILQSKLDVIEEILNSSPRPLGERAG